ncbi:MAG: hypothetical protein K8I02_06510, partial [Candidatus Methylomirabilis sp.]|nr:hypothetical protein [Deltaproteobacteria bacterium]
TIQRAESAPGPVIVAPGAGGAEAAPEMKTIDVRPFAPGVVAEPAEGAAPGAEPHTIEVQPTR